MPEQDSRAGAPAQCDPCPECGGIDTFDFRQRRLAGGAQRVMRQCRICGHANGNGVRLADHPGFASYPVFDENLRNNWWAAQAAARQSEHAARAASYAEWLETSPEWLALRQDVLERDQRRCAACLTREATEVHHQTYAYGWLPPAFELQSVCRECHARLHGPRPEEAWREADPAEQERAP
jgi:5-methylcytosine-specific restriction endonuclease McrA